MRRQSRQHVMRVLPDRFRHDEGRVWIDPPEHLQPFALAGNEAVFFRGLVSVCADGTNSFGLQRGAEGLLHGQLRRPANLVGGEPQIATGHKLNRAFRERLGRHGNQD
jgi:hypothetical protein